MNIKSQKSISLIIAFIYLVGIILHMIPATRFKVLSLSSLMLLASDLLILYFLWREHLNLRFIFICLMLFCFTMLSEISGVHTGFPFGKYLYGEVLGPKIFGVPWIIGLNWTVLILGTYSLTERVKLPQFYALLVPASLMILLDLVMEPVATRLSYWSWIGGKIPYSNYLSWFIISLIFTAVLRIAGIRLNEKLAGNYYVICFGFFVILLVYNII